MTGQLTSQISVSVPCLSIMLVSAATVLACSGVAVAQDSPGDQVTFTKHVAPILQRSCQVCHRPGSIAPMSLLTYEEARPWARAIKEHVANRIMPPWYIDKRIGIQGFKADKSLSGEEIATIVRWVDNGAPRGNLADMPPPREFQNMDQWHIGEPDWIVEIPEPFVVKAEAADWWGNLESDSGLTEDRWGVTTFNEKLGELVLKDVMVFQPACVMPPDGVNSIPWLKGGMKGAKCKN